MISLFFPNLVLSILTLFIVRLPIRTGSHVVSVYCIYNKTLLPSVRATHVLAI